MQIQKYAPRGCLAWVRITDGGHFFRTVFRPFFGFGRFSVSVSACTSCREKNSTKNISDRFSAETEIRRFSGFAVIRTQALGIPLLPRNPRNAFVFTSKSQELSIKTRRKEI